MIISLYYNVHVTLHQLVVINQVSYTLLKPFTFDEKRMKQTKAWTFFRLLCLWSVSGFKLEFKTSKQLLKEKNVLYLFDSFRVAMQQILKVLISVNYILNIIKSKIFLPQSYVTIARFGYPVETHWFSCYGQLLNYFSF